MGVTELERIYEIDKNFRAETNTAHGDAVFYDPRMEPFCIYGVFYDNGAYRRLPEEKALGISEGVHYLHAHAAGGRVRFCSDSPYIIVNAGLDGFSHMPHFPLVGSAGFDLYADGEYIRSFVPPADMRDGYESRVELGGSRMRELMIHFPLYANVRELSIGLAPDACVLPAPGYRNIPPVVYYGSSITQGGCASRPGNAYENMLSRWLNVDHLNLGFAGKAKGEPEMAAYISTLNMSVFVMDYDHNAPDAEHLKRTHERMFRTIREARQDLPIIILPRPQYRPSPAEQERAAVIKKTYENALAAGDRNVYYLESPALMAAAKCDGTVDNCHPNDLGFYSMAKALEPLLKSILQRYDG